jgi:DNA-binding NtrC family response regulator
MGTKDESTAMKLKVLFLEDSFRDFEIISTQLADSGFNPDITHAMNKAEFLSALNLETYDIILSDFKLPEFDAFGALEICKAECPDTPFICVSGSIGEETAIELLKLGAVDYVLKDRPERLPFAMRRAMEEAKEKQELKAAEKLIKSRINELELFHKLTVGRELFMIDLKKEVNELLRNAGLPEKYRIVE